MKKGIIFGLLVFSGYGVGFSSVNDVPTSFFSELLFWQVREVSDNNWAQILGPTGNYQHIQFLEVPFEWNPGFRIGLEHKIKDSPWDLAFYYTWYKSQGKNQASIAAGELHSSFLGNFFAENPTGAGVSGPYYHQGGIAWDIFFNTLDLELSRAITIDNLVDLRPFVGLKGSIINQTIHTTWQKPYDNSTKTPLTTFSVAKENIKNDFRGIGPSFGLDTRWAVYAATHQAFTIIGDFSGAFLWGHWSISDNYRNDTPFSIAIINDSLSTAAPMARGYVGLEWARDFHHSNINISLGYEAQVWFNQLRYYSFDMGKTNDALYLQGGVLDIHIYF